MALKDCTSYTRGNPAVGSGAVRHIQLFVNSTDFDGKLGRKAREKFQLNTVTKTEEHCKRYIQDIITAVNDAISRVQYNIKYVD